MNLFPWHRSQRDVFWPDRGVHLQREGAERVFGEDDRSRKRKAVRWRRKSWRERRRSFDSGSLLFFNSHFWLIFQIWILYLPFEVNDGRWFFSPKWQLTWFQAYRVKSLALFFCLDRIIWKKVQPQISLHWLATNVTVTLTTQCNFKNQHKISS